MRIIFTPLICGFLVLSCGSKVYNKADIETKQVALDPIPYAETITLDELKDKLLVFASDDFAGRDTGEPGQKKAAAYLRSQYQALEIPSPYKGDNYYQNVPLAKNEIAQTTIILNDKVYKPFEHQFCVNGGTTQSFEIDEIVYVGYGIETENYSDYKDVDVQGKVVLMKAGEATNEDGTFVSTGSTEPTIWTNGRQALTAKRNLARDKGAKAAIIFHEEFFTRYNTYYKGQSNYNKGGRFSLKDTKRTMPFFMIDDFFAKALYDKIITDNQPQALPIKATFDIKSNSRTVNSENVVAYIEGSEKPNEIIVLSAHLDHIGVSDGKIFNGADDDGSGNVALLEIAQAFKEASKNGAGPKRSLLFLHVTGEEKGLLGSRHYTDNDPIFPLENTVANLNIDMIGRTDAKHNEDNRNYIYLIGSDKLSTELHTISEEINDTFCNLELDYTYNDEKDPNRYYYRSDHYNFAKNNIPVIFYFNGTHDDYHQPSDTPDKIEYDLLENRARLVFHTAWELANREERIVVDKAE